MSVRKSPKPQKESRSFTANVLLRTWEKVQEYKNYGNWSTNQIMNQTLKSFLEIIESKDKNPQLPMVCQTFRDMAKRTRAKFK
jgi:hypothetical protein